MLLGGLLDLADLRAELGPPPLIAGGTEWADLPEFHLIQIVVKEVVLGDLLGVFIDVVRSNGKSKNR